MYRTFEFCSRPFLEVEVGAADPIQTEMSHIDMPWDIETQIRPQDSFSTALDIYIFLYSPSTDSFHFFFYSKRPPHFNG